MDDLVQRVDPTSGLLVVQPALEPWPSGVRKIGRYAVFYYVRWSTIGVGVELLGAGVAVILGPLMIGICHIKRQLAAGDAGVQEPSK